MFPPLSSPSLFLMIFLFEIPDVLKTQDIYGIVYFLYYSNKKFLMNRVTYDHFRTGLPGFQFED